MSSLRKLETNRVNTEGQVNEGFQKARLDVDGSEDARARIENELIMTSLRYSPSLSGLVKFFVSMISLVYLRFFFVTLK